jgi:hypothetical protein
MTNLTIRAAKSQISSQERDRRLAQVYSLILSWSRVNEITTDSEILDEGTESVADSAPAEQRGVD